MGLLSVLVIRNLIRNEAALEPPQMPISPILNLKKFSGGVWYIEAITGDRLDRQVVNDDIIETIIGDFVARELNRRFDSRYEFDIRCSDGEELNVIMTRKVKIY